MQYKFKYSGSTDGRKSSTNQYSNLQKNQTLPYINILDKCTQILREDRIWIRNQLKAGDPEVIIIFKEMKKPLNLQHLQIRLRKFVNGVKNKAKMEQLMKFKQNMNLGQWNRSKDQHNEKFNKSTHSRENPSYSQHMPNKSMHTSNRYNQSTQNRNYKPRINNSVQKNEKPMIYPYRNSSVNNSNTRKALENYPAPMEEITERDSENMTSARNRIRINQENQDGFAFGMNYSYSQWKRPQNTANPLQGLRKQMNESSGEFKKKYKPKHDINMNHHEYQQNDVKINISPPQTDSPQRDIYQHYNRQSLSKKDKNQSNYQNHNFMMSPQQQERHPYTYQHQYSHQHQHQHQHQQYQHQHQHQHEHYQSDDFLHHHNNNFILDRQPLRQNPQKPHEQQSFGNTYNFSQTSILKQIKEINNKASSQHKNYYDPIQPTTSTLKPITTVNDGLFTSPELLMECRNFIKNKSSVKNTVQKKDAFVFGSGYAEGDNSRYVPLSFDHHQQVSSQRAENSELIQRQENSHSPEHSQNQNQEQQIKHMQNNYIPSHNELQDTMSGPFKNINCGFIESVKISEPISHQKNTYQPPHNDASTKTYEFFQTFANQSSYKKDSQPVPAKLATAQQFVNIILDSITEQAQGYVQWNKLLRIVERKCPQYMSTFVQYLQPEEDNQHVLISNAGRVMEDLMQNQHETESEVRNIYRLFDIEHKGYINQQDLQDFILQLQQAEAEDVQTIAKYIWKLFDSIDQDSQESDQKRIDYWGIYARKTSQNFIQLNEILKQFEFQIE